MHRPPWFDVSMEEVVNVAQPGCSRNDGGSTDSRIRTVLRRTGARWVHLGCLLRSTTATLVCAGHELEDSVRLGDSARYRDTALGSVDHW